MGEPIQIGPVKADPRQRAIKIAGVAIVLLLALRFLPGILFGGGGDDPAEEFPAVVTGPGVVPLAPSSGAPETALTFTDKNPFEPLASTSPDPGAGAVTPDTVPVIEPPIVLDPLVPDDGDVSVGGGTTDPADPGTTPTTEAGPPPRQPDRVALLELFTDPAGARFARVRVNDTVHEAREGADFAVSYRLLDVDLGRRCAQLLFGDDRFTLCEGEETLK